MVPYEPKSRKKWLQVMKRAAPPAAIVYIVEKIILMNRARARRADGVVNRSQHRDERKRGITVAARYTLRTTTDAHTRAEPDTPKGGSKEH
ncbi:hypothetical protein EVAR_51928_1 [Eumeta japonica]|uniref:Uncharacterized protein n=1 Tax=Eumeta variegata TaxID=151549 RepID=A0A4C1XI91_EUMVA|nr:hypothetical protein EVAR_51928_1 [Eumeta japonica]